MLIRKPDDLKWSDVTPESLYLRRREFLASAAVPVLAGAAEPSRRRARAEAQGGGQKLTAKKSPLSTTEAQTPFDDVTTYNNFYEFGTDKGDPSRNAKNFKTRPWTVTIDGAVAKGGKFAIDDLIKPYRARGAHLPPALRRGLVDGDSLDRLPAGRSAEEGGADRRRRSSSSSRP